MIELSPLRRDKGSACFYCRHSVRRNDLVRTGTHDAIFDCALGIDNSALNGHVEVTQTCPSHDVRFGFQIGGYYTHMWFSYSGTPPEEGGEPNRCLEWHIASDGAGMQLHLCDFEQLEQFVAFWRAELERRKWLVADEDPDG